MPDTERLRHLAEAMTRRSRLEETFASPRWLVEAGGIRGIVDSVSKVVSPILSRVRTLSEMQSGMTYLVKSPEQLMYGLQVLGMVRLLRHVSGITLSPAGVSEGDTRAARIRSARAFPRWCTERVRSESWSSVPGEILGLCAATRREERHGYRTHWQWNWFAQGGVEIGFPKDYAFDREALGRKREVFIAQIKPSSTGLDLERDLIFLKPIAPDLDLPLRISDLSNDTRGDRFRVSLLELKGDTSRRDKVVSLLESGEDAFAAVAQAVLDRLQYPCSCLGLWLRREKFLDGREPGQATLITALQLGDPSDKNGAFPVFTLPLVETKVLEFLRRTQKE